MFAILSLNESDSLLPLFFPSQLVRFMASFGHSVHSLLTATQLTETQLNLPTTRANLKQVKQLIQNCERAWAKTHPNSNLALVFGQALRLQSLGMIGHAALSSATLGEAIETIVRYLSLRDPLQQYHIQHHTEGTQFSRLQLPQEQDAQSFLTESAAAAVVAFITQLCGNTVQGLEFYFASPARGPSTLYRRILGENVSFGADKPSFVLSRQLEATPLPTASPMDALEAKQYCEAELAKLGSDRGFRSVVRTLLQSQLKNPPTQAQAGLILGHSERNLRRRLAKEKVNYRDLLQEVRRENASAQLKTTKASVERIATELGYENVGNFIRAFKRWTGQTPSQYRRAVRALTD